MLEKCEFIRRDVVNLPGQRQAGPRQDPCVNGAYFPSQQDRKLRRQGAFPLDPFPGHGMAQPHQRAVQGQSVREGCPARFRKENRPLRGSQRGEMYADLMGTAGVQPESEQTAPSEGFQHAGNRYVRAFRPRALRDGWSRRPPCRSAGRSRPSVWGGAPSTTARYSRMNSDPCKRRCSRCCACAVRAASISPLVPLSSRFTGRYTKPSGQPA